MDLTGYTKMRSTPASNGSPIFIVNAALAFSGNFPLSSRVQPTVNLNKEDLSDFAIITQTLPQR